MKKFKIFAFYLFLTFCLSSCSALKNMASQAMAMKECNYTYHSIDNIVVSGISASEEISAFTLLKIVDLINNASSSIPLSMTLNLSVENPNNVQAGFERMAYQLDVDSIRITEGEISQPFSVAPHTTNVLPVNINIDLRKIIAQENSEAILKLAKNLLGIGSTPSSLKLNVKPTIKVLNRDVTAPKYIPLSFSIGDK
jgi:LEA14-like dessication related protein